MEAQARAAVGKPCGEGRPMKPSSDYSMIEALAAVLSRSADRGRSAPPHAEFARRIR